MKRTRFKEEQIIGVLKEAETGAKTGDLSHGTRRRKRRSITGRPSMAAWRCRKPSSCGHCFYISGFPRIVRAQSPRVQAGWGQQRYMLIYDRAME